MIPTWKMRTSLIFLLPTLLALPDYESYFTLSSSTGYFYNLK